MCGRELCQDLCWEPWELLLQLQEQFSHKFWPMKGKGKLIKRLNLNSAKSSIWSYTNTNIQRSNYMHSGHSATWILDLHFYLLHFCSSCTSIDGNGCVSWVLLLYLYSQSFFHVSKSPKPIMGKNLNRVGIQDCETSEAEKLFKWG